MRWFVDGNNVMGARADGWWNDPPAAARRLTERIAEWCHTHDDDVTVVFDRPVDGDTQLLAGGNLEVRHARRTGRDAADDDIVELASDATPPVTVVTSDRGLTARLPGDATTIGAGRFLAILDSTR